MFKEMQRKVRISISIDKEILGYLDYIIEKKFNGIKGVRSALIEYYLKYPKSVVNDFKALKEEELRNRGRVIV